jgi:predicted nucleic acid-binding protein
VNERVFIDSGIFIAYLNRRDRWHQQALYLFQEKNIQPYTTELVIAETYSWLLHQAGEEIARQFRLFVAVIPKLKVLYSNAEMSEATARVLEKHRGAKLTYVDANSLAQLDAHKIAAVWSTDYHLSLTGRQIRPVK